MLPPSIATRWNSLFLRWQLRHALLLAIAVRVVLSALLLYANTQAGTRNWTLTGIDVSLYVIALTMIAAAIDARRSGARDLMANLGYSRGELVALSAAPPILLETAINIAVTAA